MSFNVLAEAAKQAKAALEAAKAERQAQEAADAAAAWKQQEEIIEDAMEHAGISAVDVQIDEGGFAKLVGSVASEAEQQTAVSIAEQFDLAGLEVEIEVIESEASAEDQTSIWAEVTGETKSVTYTTVKGDSWWAISNRFYGDGSKWKMLKRANGWPRMLHPGVELTIPTESELEQWKQA